MVGARVQTLAQVVAGGASCGGSDERKMHNSWHVRHGAAGSRCSGASGGRAAVARVTTGHNIGNGGQACGVAQEPTVAARVTVCCAAGQRVGSRSGASGTVDARCSGGAVGSHDGNAMHLAQFPAWWQLVSGVGSGNDSATPTMRGPWRCGHALGSRLATTKNAATIYPI